MRYEKSMSQLRETIADVDRALLELLRRRMELAAEVGELKARRGEPVVVRDVEDRVLTRARQHADACGVSETVMATIFQSIMRGSIERQHRVGIELRRKRGSRMLVLGGAGAMGAWLTEFLTATGHTVELVDPAFATLPPSPGRYRDLDGVGDLDAFAAIWVSVPLAGTADVLDALVARRPAGLVVEIASIKAPLVPALRQATRLGVRVSSLHPMFGPGKSIYEPLTMVLACRDDEESERERLLPFLQHPYTHLITLPFGHHDRLMGWLLGLAHLSGMAFGAAIARSGLDAAELTACASTTYARQAATARSVLGEDPDLYLDIQRLNPHRDEVHRAAREALEHLSALVADGDRESFRATLTQARQALGDELA